MEVEHAELMKWNSCVEHMKLPKISASEVRRLHVYDFDNTLFKSPAPNQNILASNLVGSLVSCERFSNGGWWSEPRFLEALADEWIRLSDKGANVDAEFWITDVVELTRLSALTPDAVSILMTGRREVFFSEVIGELLSHPVKGGLLKFNAVCLKREGFSTTMTYKTSCLKSLLSSYKNLEEITIYDDRLRQLKGFQLFLNEYVGTVNSNMVYNLIHVPGEMRYLDPREEISIIQDVIKEHNRDVELRRNGRYMGKVPTIEPYFRMEKAYIREVISFVGYYISLESRKRIMQHITENYTHVFGSSDEELNQYNFSPGFIPATQVHAMPSKVMMGQFICGSKVSSPEDELTFAKYAEEFNDLKRTVHVQFKLKRFGKYQNMLFYVEVDPVPPERVVKADSVKTLFFYLGQRADSQMPVKLAHNLASSAEGMEWEDIEQDVHIQAELQYHYTYYLSGIKKQHKKQRSRK